MNPLIVPENVASQLQGLPHPVPLCDAAGTTLGYFLPASKLPVQEAELDVSDEQLRQIEASTQWYSTQQVLDYLEKRG